MMSTPEGVTDKIPNLPMTSTSVKKPSAKKTTVFIHQHIRCQKENSKTLYCSCKIKTFFIILHPICW